MREYINKHSGATAYVFGKGPSLDSFCMSSIGEGITCVINDVVSRVPNPTYCFANDEVSRWADLYRKEHILFTPERTPQPPLPCNVVYYKDDYDGQRRAFASRELLANRLVIERGTLGSLMQVLYIMGISRVLCVGIDGGQAHASGDWRTELRNEHYKSYNSIRCGAMDISLILGMELLFWNGSIFEDVMSTHYRVLKQCFIRDRALLYGATIKDLSEEDAKLLLSLGNIARLERAALAPETEKAEAKPATVSADAKPATESPAVPVAPAASQAVTRQRR